MALAGVVKVVADEVNVTSEQNRLADSGALVERGRANGRRRNNVREAMFVALAAAVGVLEAAKASDGM